MTSSILKLLTETTVISRKAHRDAHALWHKDERASRLITGSRLLLRRLFWLDSNRFFTTFSHCYYYFSSFSRLMGHFVLTYVKLKHLPIYRPTTKIRA